MIYQKAQAVLYSDDLLVLLDLDTSDFNPKMLFRFAKSVPFNTFHPDAPMPPAAVHIKHEIEVKGFENTYIVFAATDFRLVCHALHQAKYSYRSRYEGWLITLLKIPRHGWTSEKLTKSIWDHLRRRPFGE